jgi:hypothetical protein
MGEELSCAAELVEARNLVDISANDVESLVSDTLATLLAEIEK